MLNRNNKHSVNTSISVTLGLELAGIAVYHFGLLKPTVNKSTIGRALVANSTQSDANTTQRAGLTSQNRTRATNHAERFRRVI